MVSPRTPMAGSRILSSLLLCAVAVAPAEARQDLGAETVHRLYNYEFRHDAPIQGVALSWDGKRLISLDAEGHATLWDRKSGKRLYRRRIEDAFGAPRTLSISPRGKWFALPPADRKSTTMRLFDGASGKEVWITAGAVQHAFSWDERHLATSNGRVIRVWDLGTLSAIARIEDPKDALVAAAFSPDGKTLAVAQQEPNAFSLWDFKAGRRTFLSQADPYRPRASSIAFSADGKTLALGNAWGVDLWDVSGDLPKRLRETDAFGRPPLAFSGNGRWIVGTEGRNVRGVWSVGGARVHVQLSARSPRDALEPTKDEVVHVRVLGNGLTLEPIVPRREPSPKHRVENRGVAAAGFAPKGRSVTCGFDGTLSTWEAANGREIHRWTVPKPERITLSRDGTSVAFLWNSSELGTWDPATGRERIRLKADGIVTSLALSPGGHLLAVGTMEGALTVWNAKDGRKRFEIAGRGRPVSAIGWSVDGALVAWGTAVGNLVVARVDKEREGMRFRPRGGRITALAFSADRRSIVTGEDNGTVRLWSLGLDGEPRVIHRGWPRVQAVALSADGRWLAMGGLDGLVRLRPLFPRGSRLVYSGHKGAITSLRFSPDGGRLLSGGADGTAVIWYVPKKEE